MRPCPNCGQDAATSDRFCPHCGYLLPWAQSAAASPQAPSPNGATASGQGQAYTPPVQPRPAYASPVQPQRQPAPQAAYTAQPPYADPNATTAPNTPAYVNNDMYGGNLPLPRVQQAPTPVAPVKGADPLMNTLSGLGSSFGASNARGLLRLAVIVLAVIVVLAVVFKLIAFALGLLPWLLLIAAIVVAWQYRKRRRRRRP